MFVKLVNTSISASWLILAVIVLRLLLKKVPKAIDCALWGLVAIRLMCPFSITSSLSLIPNTETIPENTLYMEVPVQSDHVAVDVVTNPVLPEIADMEVDTAVRQIQGFDMYGTLIWVAGMVLILLYAMVSYLRLRWKVSASIRTKENIWICDQVDSPFILGILRPRIYLPSSMEESQFSYVVAHEQAHLKRRDHWWKPLGFVLLAVYWFNPLIWIAYILLCRDIEMACDEKVVRDMGIQEKKEYSEALLSYSITYQMISACPLAFGEVGVKERVKSVLNYKKPAFWVMPLSVVICMAIAICFLTNPKENEDKLDDANPIALGETISWMYAPDGVAWHTAFHFNFKLEYTHIEASCDKGMLWDLYSEGKTKGQSLRFESGNSVCWTPGRETYENLTEEAKIVFTVYRGEEELYSGELALTQIDDDDNVVEYEAQLIAGDGLTLLKTDGNFGGTITLSDFSGNTCNHIPGTYISTKWEDVPNLNSEKNDIIELKWDTYTCAYCGVPFDYNTATYRVRQSGNRWSGHPLSPSDFDDPVATAEILLSRAFSFEPSDYKSTVSQNGDFWNITFDGEHHYIVEISKKLPYPQTLYQNHRVPPDGYDEVQIPIEGELVDIAEDFLFNVYGLKRDNAKDIDVFQYENKICVQFVMSDTEIFHVRIHTGDLQPSGILFFNNIETARLAMEKAGAV